MSLHVSAQYLQRKEQCVIGEAYGRIDRRLRFE